MVPKYLNYRRFNKIIICHLPALVVSNDNNLTIFTCNHCSWHIHKLFIIIFFALLCDMYCFRHLSKNKGAFNTGFTEIVIYTFTCFSKKNLMQFWKMFIVKISKTGIDKECYWSRENRSFLSSIDLYYLLFHYFDLLISNLVAWKAGKAVVSAPKLYLVKY